jgi:LacI family transcriptional regulator
MATLKQIAAEAGVSLYTVSRVLSGQAQQSRISAERTAEIQQIAQRLNFRPNGAARSMRMQRTRQVGVLIRNRPGRSRHTHPLAFETILGVNEGLQLANYVLSIVRLTDVEDATHSRVFTENLLDGMIVVDAMPDDVTDVLRRRVKNCLWVDSNIWRDQYCIRRDEHHAGRLAASQAANLGYRDWVWAGLNPGPDRNYSLTERFAGVQEVAQDRGAIVRSLVIASAYAGTLDPAIFDMLRPQTCVIAYGLYQARSIAHLAASMGKCPGHDFGLLCCDDSHDTHRMWPGLSRVTFDRFEMGLQAAQMMLRLLEDPEGDFTSQKLRGSWHAGNTAWGPLSVGINP